MVIKKRSNSNDRFVLARINEYKEKDKMKTIVITSSQNHLYEEDPAPAFWRLWSSTSQLLQCSKSKKLDSLPSWCKTQDDFCDFAQPKSHVMFTTKRKKAIYGLC
jgi:hypothetical protein